jgi:nitrite reductase/ring-hydroxylating ferredoxin subunit
MSDWVHVADTTDISVDEAFATEWQGEAIALYRLDDQIYAIGDICPHEDVRLSEGWLEDGKIECPLHQACFEIRTGKVIEGGPTDEDVSCYDVKIDGDAVLVRRAA